MIMYELLYDTLWYPKSHFFRQTCQTCLQSMLSMGQSEAAGPTVLLQQAEKLWAKHNLHVLRLPKSRGYHGVPQIIQDHPVVMDDHKIVLKQFETYWNPWWRLGIHHFKKPPHLDSSRQAASLWKYLLRWQRPLPRSKCRWGPTSHHLRWWLGCWNLHWLRQR